MGLDQLPPPPPQLHRTSTTTTPPAYGHGPLDRFRRDHHHKHPSGSGLPNLSQNHHRSRRSFYDNDVVAGGTISLPETPRISSASSSRRSDVEYQAHRLSLQISNNKENINDFEISARKRRELLNYKRADEDLLPKSRSDYAKEIVKQIKENVVRRKVGLNDITNTLKSGDQKVTTKTDVDDHVVLLKPKKPSNKVNHVTKKVGGHESAAPSKQSTPSCSPRLLDIMINEPLGTKNYHPSSESPRLVSTWSPSPENQPQPPPSGKVHLTSKPQPLKLRDQEQQNPAGVVKKPKKDDKEEKCGSGISSRRSKPQAVDLIMKKKEEPFIRPTTAQRGNNGTDKKCKKTPISNDIFNISVPNLLPVKKQAQASSSDGELKWKSSPQIYSGSSQGYNKHQKKVVTDSPNFQEYNPDRNYRTTTSTNVVVASSSSSSSSCGDGEVVELEYRHYIQRILKRAGVDKSTPVSLAKWYSPSHPLDPSIFHYIELFHPTHHAVTNVNKSPAELNLRCNRKLVFQLVDELLADVLKPYLVAGSRCRNRDQMYGSELIEVLCSRIKKFPRADCKVLEDIDALIDTDLGNAASSSSLSWVHANCDEEEREKLVEEIQRDIMKSLVHDTTKMATQQVF
ncbi:OLC1v1027304C2 [Oldenlandia corymbosa var. corymbosa]|nr:OLC1v1027304C2 [Oldenlandia corymbosa var. corymbosa]